MSSEVKIRASSAHRCRKCLLLEFRGEFPRPPAGIQAWLGGLIHERYPDLWVEERGGEIVDREKELENEFFVGHCDGVWVCGNKRKVWELKTINSFIYKEVDGVLPPHRIQINLYMHLLGIKEGIVVYLNRDTGEVKEFEITYSSTLYKLTELKAKRVISAYQQGLTPADLPGGEPCDPYCPFREEGDDPEPLPNGVEELGEMEEREELEKILKEYKALSAQKKELEGQLKTLQQQAENILRLRGLRKIRGFGGFVEPKPSLRLRRGFIKKIEKLHPEWVEEVVRKPYFKFSSIKKS